MTKNQKTVVQADEVGFDTVVGMLYSNLLAYCMIITGAMMLHNRSTNELQDVSSLATALQPVAGDTAFALFSLGIIVSGFLAIPVLAGSTAYAVADSFGWREGMDYKVSDAKGFYIVFLGALLVGDLIDLFPGISIVDALYYSQVLDGLLIPLLIGISLSIANNSVIMGRYTATRFQNRFSMLALLVTSLLTVVLLWHWID